MSSRRRFLSGRRAAAARSARRGMSLVEVIVALLILTGVLLALGGFTAKYAQASGQAQFVITANELASQRLDAVRTQPSYSAINLLVDSTTVKSDFRYFTVKTRVKQIGGGVTDSIDYKLVTVIVTHPSMRKPVSKTTAVAAF
jgi:prepilin-type N-terminal cleavage/methylation domain-containing protein